MEVERIGVLFLENAAEVHPTGVTASDIDSLTTHVLQIQHRMCRGLDLRCRRLSTSLGLLRTLVGDDIVLHQLLEAILKFRRLLEEVFKHEQQLKNFVLPRADEHNLTGGRVSLQVAIHQTWRMETCALNQYPLDLCFELLLAYKLR